MKNLKEYLKLNESYYLDDYRNSKFDSIKDVLNMFKKTVDENKIKNSLINNINWNNINESDFKEISKDELHDIFYSRKKDENTINMVLYKHKESNKFIGFSFNKDIAPLTFVKAYDDYYEIDWLGPEPNSFQSTGEWPTKKKFETVAKYDGLSYFYTKIKL